MKIVALSLLMFSPALADISACRKAFINDPYDAAIKECSPLAKAGSPEAQLDLGLMYDFGQGVPQNYEEAVRWYSLAAEQGNASAQANLGLMYDFGQGVPQNYEEAVRWYSLAAEQGNAHAQFDLGVMYNTGQGVPQDYEEAVRWYSLAAEQGHAPAQINLGLTYITGKGVPQDYVQAHMWFNLAGAAGSPEGVKSRDIVAAKMTPAQLADAQRLAREWKPSKPKIVGMINSQAGQYSVTPTAVIAKKEADVSDTVIAAIDNKSSSSTGNIPNETRISKPNTLAQPLPSIPTAGKTRTLTVVALSHSMSEYNFTVTTPRTTNTNCDLYPNSVNCRSTSSGGDTQEKAIYTFLQVVSATEGGKVTQYTLSRTARWIWSSTTQLTDGESFPAEIKGKRMSITSRRGGNQGKKETTTYDILDIRPIQ